MNKNFMGISEYKKHAKAAFIIILAFLFIVPIFIPLKSFAHCGSACTDTLTRHHRELLRPEIAQHTSNRFRQHREWLLQDFFVGQVLPALELFTEQMSSIAMHQTMTIGTFLDAKHQLETQRLLQELQVQAHKDYQPSEDFCWFGTNVRSLANTEAQSHADTYVLSRRQLARHLGQKNIGAAESRDTDKYARWLQYKKYFCDPKDSNWTEKDTGLEAFCDPEPTTDEYTNADIDYSRLIENKRTIQLAADPSTDLSFHLLRDYSRYRGGSSINLSDMSVMALQNNLYGHNIISRDLNKDSLKDEQYQQWYMALRSVVAKRSVAENSFNAIVGMKSAGTSEIRGSGVGPGAPSTANTSEFLGAIMVELGIPEGEVANIIGQEPSYYAQLEILAKRIYQNPDFYAGLYDKPANVKRKSVALKAIELMVDRAIYESQIRQEMLSSVLLSARLREPFKEAERGLTPKAN